MGFGSSNSLAVYAIDLLPSLRGASRVYVAVGSIAANQFGPRAARCPLWPQ
jgi:hypothetical protein